jgi:hypothetical protein
MMKAARTSETSVDIQLRTRQCIPEDSELHTRRRENLKSRIVNLYGEATLRFIRSFIALMMEAARTSETSVYIQLRTRHYIPEDSELDINVFYPQCYHTTHTLAQGNFMTRNYAVCPYEDFRALNEVLRHEGEWGSGGLALHIHSLDPRLR